MHSIVRLTVLTAVFVMAGCAHQINISPPLNTISDAGVTKIDKVVGYFISAADREKEVETPGGGGDKVKYLPYRESETALKHVLSNVFAEVVSIPSLDDKQLIASKKIAFVFIPVITTDSSSSSSMTWPPTNFTVTIDARATGPTGATVWQKTVKSSGNASFSEFRSNHSLSAQRASTNAFMVLQREISDAKEFR